MQVYTGGKSGADFKEIASKGVGVMVSSCWPIKVDKVWKTVPCALDNGAFSCYTKKYPFMAKPFEETMLSCYKHNIPLNFIVCPDIVTGGLRSLDHSLKWATGLLVGCPNLALAVQDGMRPYDVQRVNHDLFSWIFIGGSKEWKWDTAKSWIDWAHEHGKRCHIGRCGTGPDMTRAYNLGADSCDSTSLARNRSWHHLDYYLEHTGQKQSAWLD